MGRAYGAHLVMRAYSKLPVHGSGGAFHFFSLQGMTTAISKDHLRRIFLARREAIDASVRLRETAAVTALFHAKIRPDKKNIIAGYWPVRGEMDILPVLRGGRAALPVVTGDQNEPFSFYPWNDATPMRISVFKIPEPAIEGVSSVLPDIILTPLLAFDRQGYRLGYGRGMYDRVLRRLKAVKSVITIGVAFNDQLCDDLPHEAGDEKLDWILTAHEALYFGDKKP